MQFLVDILPVSFIEFHLTTNSVQCENNMLKIWLICVKNLSLTQFVTFTLAVLLTLKFI